VNALWVALLCASGLYAATGVEIWTGPDLKNFSGQLASEADSRGMAGKTLGAATLWRRSKSGEAELHKTKADLLIVEQGAATLVFGGTIPDAKITAPNEVRGASIRGGESRRVEAGDIIRIPPGTPHQFVLDKGQSVAYFAFKIAR
jgi:mannose-6-phosphate isomerase-like protein (cupin superfamily)